jgi:CBS-domain-containing membrane protein
MITDRDICMAVATKCREAAGITAAEVLSGQLYACAPDDDIKEALGTMAEHQVRRLPVVDAFGGIEGLLSFNDIVLHADRAKGKKPPALSCEEVLKALKAICAHRTPVGV